MRKKRKGLKLGDKISRLEVIRLDHKNEHHSAYYLFKCDCGNNKVIKGSRVTSGSTKSCGCLNREMDRTRRKLPDNGAVINAIILQYKEGARRRGLPFLLGDEEFTAIIRRNCFYCGLVPSNRKHLKACPEGYAYSGIDRVDPKGGYLSDNVVPCCIECNRAKGRRSPVRFEAWIARLVAHATNPTT